MKCFRVLELRLVIKSVRQLFLLGAMMAQICPGEVKHECHERNKSVNREVMGMGYSIKLELWI